MSNPETEDYDIILDKEESAVHIHNDRDKANLPAAYTVKNDRSIGNSKTFEEASKLARESNNFREAIRKWEENGIRFHYFCRVD